MIVTRWFVTYRDCLCTGLYATRPEAQSLVCPTHPGNGRLGSPEATRCEDTEPLGMETLPAWDRRMLGT